MGLPGGVHDLDPGGVRPRQFQVPAADALEESQTVSLKPVWLGGRPAWAAMPRIRVARPAGMRPRQSGSRVEVKDHRQIRLEGPAHRTVESCNNVLSEPSPEALIGKTRGAEQILLRGTRFSRQPGRLLSPLQQLSE